MKFTYKSFSCDVELFHNEEGIVIRFYDSSKEQNEEQIHDLVIVDSGYGFLCLKVKEDSGLLSGYLDETVFSSEEMVDALIEFLEKHFACPEPLYYHIDRVKLTNYVEHNGEY